MSWFIFHAMSWINNGIHWDIHIYLYIYIYIYNCSSVPIFFQIQLDLLRFCVLLRAMEALVDYMRHAAALMLEKPLGTAAGILGDEI